jgi:hypothetical protein
MTDQTRLSEHTRASIRSDGLTLESREQTGRGHRFGEAGRLVLHEEEMRALYEVLRDHYGDSEPTMFVPVMARSRYESGEAGADEWKTGVVHVNETKTDAVKLTYADGTEEELPAAVVLGATIEDASEDDND